MSNIYVTHNRDRMPLTVVAYYREEGSSPYDVWYHELPLQAAAKVAVARARLEMGNTSAVKWIGVIGEYRIDWGPGYRIYLAAAGIGRVILPCGGTKQRQSIDVNRARALWAEYKARSTSRSWEKE